MVVRAGCTPGLSRSPVFVSAGFYIKYQWMGLIHVLHRQIDNGLAPPRKVETRQNQEQIPLTQTTVDRHHSQIKHRIPPKNHTTDQDA